MFAKRNLVDGFKPWRKLCAVAMIALSFTAVEVQAEVLLDTFAAGNTAPGPSWSLYSETDVNGGYSGQGLAVSFSASSAVTIDSILAAITGSGNVTLGIMSDVGGVPANSFLHSTVLSNPTANVSLTGLNWALGAGNYWLAAVGQAGFSGTWPGGITGAGWAFTMNSPTNWLPTSGNDNPAARITTAVPEPETYAMLLAGLGLMGAMARRRKQK